MGVMSMGLLNKVQARFKLSDTAALAYAHGVGVSVSSRYILRGVRMKVALAVLALAGTGRGFLQAPGSRLGLVSRRAVEDAPSTAVGFADLDDGFFRLELFLDTLFLEGFELEEQLALVALDLAQLEGLAAEHVAARRHLGIIILQCAKGAEEMKS